MESESTGGIEQELREDWNYPTLTNPLIATSYFKIQVSHG